MPVPNIAMGLPNGKTPLGGRPTLISPLLIMVFAFFSPLLAYGLALLVLIVRTHEIGSQERKLLGFAIAFAGAVIVSSRAIGADGDDLAEHYYPVYLEITSGDFSSFFEWGWGIEVGINVINTLLAVVLPKLTESGYAFALAFISGVIFVLIVEKYLLRDSSQSKKAVAAAVIYAMYSVYFSTQLSRQFFAGLFLIVALFEYRRATVYKAIFVGALFHLSTLPLYVFYRLAGWFRLNRLYLFIPIAIGAYFLVEMMGPLLELVSSGLPDTRLLYYAEGEGRITNFIQFRYLLVVLISVLGILVLGFKHLNSRDKEWISIYLVVVTLYALTLDLRLFPARTFLLIHGMILGWFFVMVYRRFSVRSCMVISLLVVIFFIQGKTFVDPKVPNALWTQFDRASVIPGYYMLHYFK